MAVARTLFLFSPNPDGQAGLRRLVGDMGDGRAIQSEELTSFEELRGMLEGGQLEFVLMDAREVGSRMRSCLGEPEPENLLGLSLAELEKRHILRVLASTGGNKTRAARILGIDTKTLYNKLKSYQVSETARKRRLESTQRSVGA